MRNVASKVNHMPDVNVFDTHAGLEGGNQVRVDIALAQVNQTLEALRAGKIQLAEPLTTRQVPAGELFPGSAACTEITAKIQHARKGRKGSELSANLEMIDKLMSEISSGKRAVYGVKHTRIAFAGQPRTDVFKSYVETL